MSAPNPVPFDEVAKFLADRFGVPPGDIEVLEGGEWSQAFAFDDSGVPLVLRVGFQLEDYESDRRAMSYGSEELPVPPVTEIGEAFGRYYAVSRRAAGRFLDALDETGWRAVLPALWRGLDHLRSCPPAFVPDGDWREGLVHSLEDRPGRVSGWEPRLESMPEVSELFRAGAAELAGVLRHCPPERYVIHGDLLYRNVLVSDDACKLVAVFDWGCSLAVDFLYEIAALSFFGGWYPALGALGLREAAQEHYDAIGLAVPDYDGRMRAYELHIGLLHIVYSIFADRPDVELRFMVDRTRQVLEVGL